MYTALRNTQINVVSLPRRSDVAKSHDTRQPVIAACLIQNMTHPDDKRIKIVMPSFVMTMISDRNGDGEIDSSKQTRNANEENKATPSNANKHLRQCCCEDRETMAVTR